jgi:MFS family permease
MPTRSTRTIHLATFVVAVILFWAALYVYVPTLPEHAQSLSATATMIGLIAGSYGLTQLILRIPLGILSDRFRRRKAFVLAGFVVVAGSSVLLAISRSPSQMLVGRALAGVAACAWVPCTVLFCSLFPAERAVQATAIMSFSSSFGQMISNLSGGMIAQRFGTAAPFWVASVIAVIGLLVMLPVAEERTCGGTTPSFKSVLGVLAIPTLLAVSLVAAITQYASVATSHAFVSIYATEALKLDLTALGMLGFAALVPSAIMAGTVAIISARVDEKWLITLGLLLLAGSTAAIPFTTSFGTLALTRVVFGFGQGLTYPVLMGLAVKFVTQERRASAMGAFQAIYAIGMTAGPSLSGYIKDTHGIAPVFWLTGIMCLVGLLPIWLVVARAGQARQVAKSPALS